MSGQFDPADVDIRPAATVMLVDDRPDLQVYIMERNANILFGGGMWVFPGGRVDETDHPELFAPYCRQRTDAQASQLMGLPHGGLAFYVAAVREAFEEAGILLARKRGATGVLTLDNPERIARFEAHRRDINDSNREFLELVKDEDLLLDTGNMHYVARWITPAGPPRRYDTRFFVARMPREQTPIQDDHELVHAEWLSPADLLTRHAAGPILMTPTLRMVQSLSQFSAADQVIEAARANRPDQRARMTATGDMVLPGEPGYAQGDEEQESGWVRLRPL